MYTMLCIRLDICYAIGIVTRYQSNLKYNHSIVIKMILKYLGKTKNTQDIRTSIFKLIKIRENSHHD